jgi:hypothetical protein
MARPAPARGLTPYQAFAAEMGTKHKEWFERMSGLEVCRRMAMEWNNLTPEERSIYQTISARSMEYFRSESGLVSFIHPRSQASDFVRREREFMSAIPVAHPIPQFHASDPSPASPPALRPQRVPRPAPTPRPPPPRRGNPKRS